MDTWDENVFLFFGKKSLICTDYSKVLRLLDNFNFIHWKIWENVKDSFVRTISIILMTVIVLIWSLLMVLMLNIRMILLRIILRLLRLFILMMWWVLILTSSILRFFKLILTLSQVTMLFVEFWLEHVDRNHGDDEDKGRKSSNIPHHFSHILLTAPVAGSHSIVRPVDVSVILQHVVPVPHPEQQDHQVLPDYPDLNYLPAALLRSSNQSNVDHEVGDWHDDQWTWSNFLKWFLK